MNQDEADERLAENEVMFRQYNERVKQGFDELHRLAKEDDQEEMLSHSDETLLFHCECADENCTQRVAVKPSQYTKIHKKRDQFVVVCGHEVLSTEKVVAKEPAYCVVQKLTPPPQTASHFNESDIDNF